MKKSLQLLVTNETWIKKRELPELSKKKKTFADPAKIDWRILYRQSMLYVHDSFQRSKFLSKHIFENFVYVEILIVGLEIWRSLIFLITRTSRVRWKRKVMSRYHFQFVLFPFLWQTLFPTRKIICILNVSWSSESASFWCLAFMLSSFTTSFILCILSNYHNHRFFNLLSFQILTVSFIRRRLRSSTGNFCSVTRSFSNLKF